MKPLLFDLDSKNSPTPTNRNVSDTDLHGHSNVNSLSVSVFKTLETDDEPPSDMETVSTRSSLGKAYKSCGIGKHSLSSHMCNSTDGFINEMKGLQRRETSRNLQNDPLYTKWQEFKLLSKRLQKIQYRAWYMYIHVYIEKEGDSKCHRSETYHLVCSNERKVHVTSTFSV